MNQDSVKERLQAVRPVPGVEFTVVFSGKTSKKVNGCFHPENLQIIIHNRNFADDNSLLYTAFHEYAHLIQHIETGKTGHNKQFWAIFNALLDKAADLGLWSHPENNHDVTEIIGSIQGLLKQHAAIESKIGNSLCELQKICDAHQIRSEVIIDRDLKLNRRTAERFKKAMVYELFDEEEYANCAMVAAVAAVPNSQKQELIENLTDSETTNIYTPVVPVDSFLSPSAGEAAEDDQEKLAYVRLAKKRDRLDRTIGKLTEERIKVEHQMVTLGSEVKS